MQNKNALKSALLALIFIIIVILAALGFYFSTNIDSNQEEPQVQGETTTTFTINVEIADSETYQTTANEEETAFDVLEDLHTNKGFEFTYDEYDFGAMITSIANITPSNNQFWKFQVNGQDSTVGVSDYKVQEGDTLTFVLDDIQF